MKNLFCKALLLCAASLFGLTSCEESGQVDIIIPVEKVTVEVKDGSFSDLYPESDAIYFNIGEGSKSELAEIDPIQLIATVLPSDATVKNISWLSDDVTVATVTSDGIVTPVGGGAAKITAVAGSQQTGTIEKVVKVIVDKDPHDDGEGNSDLTISDEEITLYINNGVCDSYELTAELSRNVTSYTYADIQWKSGNDNFATVDETGKVTAVGRTISGTNITAYIEDKDGNEVISASCRAYVSTTVYEIAIDANSQSETRLISVAEGDPNGKDLLYGEMVYGVIEELDGSTTITPYVGLVAELRNNGADFVFNTTLTHSQPYDNSVTWTSSDWTVATVDAETGVVKVVAPGFAIVTASANGIYPGGDAVTASALIYVDKQDPVALTSAYISADIAGITALTEKDKNGNPYAMVGMDKLLRLYANIDPSNATDIIEEWSVTSNNEKYTSSFDDKNDGLILGGTLKDGEIEADITVALTATAGGATASNTGFVKVIREAEQVEITSDTPSSMPINANMTFKADLKADLGSGMQVVTDGQIYDTSLTWSVEKGNESAFIETSTGTLMVKSGATPGSEVTVRATANNGSWEVNNPSPVYDEFIFSVVQNLIAITKTEITTDADQITNNDPKDEGYNEFDSKDIEGNNKSISIQANYDGTKYNDSGEQQEKTLNLTTKYNYGGTRPTNTLTEWVISDVNGATDTEILSTNNSSADKSIVTLSIGKERGSFKLTAKSTSNGLFTSYSENTTVTDEITITITDIKAREVVVSSDATGISETDGSLTLNARLIPRYATDQSVSWTAKDGASDASVTPNSKSATGTASDLEYTITANSSVAKDFVDVVATALNGASDDKASEPFRVDIGTYPDVVTIGTVTYPTSGVFYVGDTMNLTASTTYGGASQSIIQTVIWSSDNEDVVTVDSATGKVTAIGKGTANITATSAGNAPAALTPAFASVNIEVSGYEITSVTAKSSVTAAVGTQISLSELAEIACTFNTSYTDYKGDDFDEDVTYSYSSSDNTIFDLSAGNTDGLMTALKSSSSAVTITVKATGVDSGTEKTTTIAINAINTISGVDVSCTTLSEGGKFSWVKGADNSFTLDYTKTYNSGSGDGSDESIDVVWTSSNQDFVTIDDTNKVTVLGATSEDITITLTATGSTSGEVVEDTFTFSISAAIESVSLSTTTLSLYDDSSVGANNGKVNIKSEPFDTGKADKAIWILSGATMSYTDSEGVKHTGVEIADGDIKNYLTSTDFDINGYEIKINNLDPDALGYTNVNIEANLSVNVTYNTNETKILNCKIFVYDKVTTTPGFDLGGDL